MKRIIAFSLSVLFLQTALLQAQEKQETTKDSSNVMLYADARLDIITKQHKNVQTGVIRSGKGFRVQIYNGNDREMATSIKTSFLRKYPEVRAYMTYIQPQFRVKVGDFATRADAQKLYNEIKFDYTAVMVVPDFVVINTLKDERANQE